jgi:hypothetical protein
MHACWIPELWKQEQSPWQHKKERFCSGSVQLGECKEVRTGEFATGVYTRKCAEVPSFSVRVSLCTSAAPSESR